MLITLDRMLLFYSLLLGIDVGFTVMRQDKQNNMTKYYLITFINDDYNYINSRNHFKTQHISGGRNRNTRLRNKTIKLKHIKLSINIENNNKMVSELYKKISIPEIDNYLYYNPKNNKYISDIVEKTYNFISSPENKNNLIKYVQFMNSTSYDKEYIAKLIYLKYLESRQFRPNVLIKDNTYCDRLNLGYIGYGSIYTLPDIDAKLNEVVAYYETVDKPFATYIKSIHSLLWILTKYEDIESDSGFGEYNAEHFKEYLTEELKEQLREDIRKENKDINKNNVIIKDSKDELNEMIWTVKYDYGEKYPEIYKKVFYTPDWNLIDLSQIIYYIDKYDLDVFTVLNRLSADYSWAMYKVKPVKPGIQSTSIMILGDLEYDFDMRLDRTPEVQEMVDEIDNIKTGHYYEDFNRSADTLISLFIRTVEKYLVWGAEIF